MISIEPAQRRRLKLDPIKPLTPAMVPSTNFGFECTCKFELSLCSYHIHIRGLTGADLRYYEDQLRNGSSAAVRIRPEGVN